MNDTEDARNASPASLPLRTMWWWGSSVLSYKGWVVVMAGRYDISDLCFRFGVFSRAETCSL